MSMLAMSIYISPILTTIMIPMLKVSEEIAPANANPALGPIRAQSLKFPDHANYAVCM